MNMPVDLVLVRHGESEGNVARKLSLNGDDSVFTEEFRGRHNSRLRLTNRGREQARATGIWLKSNMPRTYDRYLVSGYLRAVETAALLDLPDAVWHQEFYLRERDLGLFEIMPENDKKNKHPEVYRQFQLDPFYWIPPNGESIAQLCLRVDRVLHTLHRECSDKRVLIVCHGLVIWAFRIRIERFTPTQYLKKSQSRKSADQIHNCQVIHYTRRDPGIGQLSDSLEWVRSVCPWNESSRDSKWQKICRPTFTNKDLQELAEMSPRVIT